MVRFVFQQVLDILYYVSSMIKRLDFILNTKYFIFDTKLGAGIALFFVVY